ncbi:MAG: DUF3794 domain-containing protein [Halanaerobiaceae bacterium]
MPVKRESNSKLIEARIVVGENIINRMETINIEVANKLLKIRDVKANVKNISAEIISNSVIIKGFLESQVFYYDREKNTQKEVKETGFNYIVDIPGVDQGMDTILEPTIKHILSKVDSNNNIESKIFIQLFVKVTTDEKIRVITGEGPLVKARYIVGEYSFDSLIENDVTLAVNGVEIFDIKAEAEVMNWQIDNNMLKVEGNIHKDLIYMSEDNVEHHQDEDIPFCLSKELSVLDDKLDIDIEANIEELEYNLNETGKKVVQRILLNLNIKLSEFYQINIMTGDNALVLFPEIIGENIRTIKNESNIKLEHDLKEIKEIDTSFEEVNTVLLNEKVLINGRLKIQISYLASDDMLYHQTISNSITDYIDIEGARPGMNIEIMPTISLEKADIYEGSRLIQNSSLEIFVKVTEDIQYNVSELSI